jgi:pyruvate/2-oxoacid:ferredoxin oxidoreductase alpha subunit
MAKIVIDTANHIAGHAAKAAGVKVVAASPITPQTTIMEKMLNLLKMDS